MVRGCFVGGCRVFLGVTVVFDISDVAVVVIGFVIDGLSAAIGQVNVVRARNVSLTIASLLVAEIVVIIVFDVVGEMVRHRRLVLVLKIISHFLVVDDRINEIKMAAVMTYVVVGLGGRISRGVVVSGGLVAVGSHDDANQSGQDEDLKNTIQITRFYLNFDLFSSHISSRLKFDLTVPS